MSAGHFFVLPLLCDFCGALPPADLRAVCFVRAIAHSESTGANEYGDYGVSTALAMATNHQTDTPICFNRII